MKTKTDNLSKYEETIQKMEEIFPASVVALIKANFAIVEATRKAEDLFLEAFGPKEENARIYFRKCAESMDAAESETWKRACIELNNFLYDLFNEATVEGFIKEE